MFLNDVNFQCFPNRHNIFLKFLVTKKIDMGALFLCFCLFPSYEYVIHVDNLILSFASTASECPYPITIPIGNSPMIPIFES